MMRLLVLLLASSVLASSAAAQDEASTSRDSAAEEEARREYELGATSFQGGQYPDALVHFERAYELVRLPALLFNVATTLDRLGRVNDALLNYRAYLDAEEAARVGYVRSRIRLLEARIEAPNQASAEPESLGELEPLPPEIALEEQSRVAPIVMMIAGGALALASAGPGIAALSVRSDLRERCVDGRCAEADRADADRMDRLALSADVLVTVGLAVGVAGLVWFLLSPRYAEAEESEAEAPPVAVSCTTDGCATSATITF